MDPPAIPRHRLSLASVAAIFLAMHAFFAFEVYLDLRHAAPTVGLSVADLWRMLDGSAALARNSGSVISRAYNVLVSLVVTSIALAVPLTANMYTPKLVEIFLKDKVNRGVLGFFVFSAAQAIWSAHASWDQGPLKASGGFYARITTHVSLETMLLGWAMVIPYFYYALRFLNPTQIIARVSKLVTDQIDSIPRAPGADFPRAQRDLEQQILHLGNVVLRAIDRADRDVTLDAIAALERVTARYQRLKRGLPDGWFRPAPPFVGLSEAALRVIEEERIWVEQKCLHQLSLAYNASLAKMQDAISAISDVNRALVLNAKREGDLPSLRLGIRYFNTFIREAIKRKDAHAIFDVFYQYKELAHDLFADHGDLALAMGRYLKYYADYARISGLTFIYELAAYDLEGMIERAGAGRGELLDLLMKFDAAPSSTRLVKAKLICGGHLQQAAAEADAARLAAHLRPTPPELLAEALRELAETDDPIFWEVTDRQVNIDYVDAARKAAILTFIARVSGA